MDVGAAFSEALTRFERGDLAGAEAGLRNLLAADPTHANAAHLLAGVLHARGDLPAAAAQFEKAAALAPRDASVAFNRAACLTALERHAEALAAYDALLLLTPRDSEALYNRGLALMALKRPAEALASYDAAKAAGFVPPGAADALGVNRGIALAALGRSEEALACFDLAARRDPRDVNAHFNRGAALDGLERFDESVAAYDAAIALKPDHAKAWMQRAGALADVGKFEEAIASAAAATRIAPQRIDLKRDQAAILLDAQRGEDAIAQLEQLLADAPRDADLRYALAYCYLRLGDFARGLPLYESRWGAEHGPRPSAAHAPLLTPEKLWLGKGELQGKRLLLRGEQGFGDLFQFSRFAPELAARGAYVIFQERAPTLDLVRTIEGVREVIADDAPLPDFDWHMPLVSAPFALGVRLDTIPARTPYLHPPQERIDVWRERLGPRRRPRVGVVWSGGQLSRFQRRRTLPLDALAQLMETPADWISLQLDSGDAADILARGGARTFGDEIKPFVDLAALIKNLDLVISIDTGAAHLAGALDMPTLLMLPFAPEWRWMRDREDTPWYPKMRLLRQKQFGDWRAPVGAAKAAVAALQP